MIDPKHPRISVVMSVHNGDRYLEEAITSVRAQTCRDFEFIIVNDGSSDRSVEILAGHAREDARICVIHQEHSGLIESLDRGLARATGEFIARMDADDVARCERFESQICYLDSNPSIAVVGSAVETIDSASRIISRISVPSDSDTVRNHMRERGCVIFHPTVMIRRTAFEVSGGFRKAYRHAEDYDLWLRMLEKFNLANIDEVLLGYRRHKKAVSFHSARQQAISALCARITAQMRLRGEADRTSQLDLIEEATLIELGVNQDAINEAILSHIIAVTEDLIRSGVSSAAAEFPEMARTCASPARIRSIAMKLNQKALGAVADRSERRTHRARLLATCPEVYWELFGSGRSKYLRTSS